jgi:hypothetical protein
MAKKAFKLCPAKFNAAVLMGLLFREVRAIGAEREWCAVRPTGIPAPPAAGP